MLILSFDTNATSFTTHSYTMRFIFLFCVFLFACNNSVHTTQDYEKKIAYYNEQFSYYQRNSIDTAKLYIDSILNTSQQHQYKFGLALAKLNAGLLEQVQSNYHIAIQNNENALKEFTELNNDKYIAKSYASIGVNYWQLSEFDSAMHHFIEALKINEKLNLPNEIANCNNYISMVFQLKEQIDPAQKYADKAYNIIIKEKSDRSHIGIYHNLANLFGMQGKYAQALKMDSIGLLLCEKLNLAFSKSMFYDNIANCLYYSKDYKKALLYHQKAISIDSTFGNEKQMGDSYSNLASVYYSMNMPEEAIKYYEKSILLCKKTGYKVGLNNAYSALSKIYSANNNPTKAYEMLVSSMNYKDSILNEETERTIAELQTLYDTEKKQQQIVQQTLIISRRNIFIFTLFMLLLLAVITFYIINNRNKIRQERKLQEELVKEQEKRTLAILETEENERQRLARELHDGVGQLLAASKLQLNSIDTECENNANIKQSIVILDESIKEIRNISHNMVPDILIKTGLENAIRVLFARINQSKQIEIEMECNNFDEASINLTEKLMLYRIVQETVSNTLKYANATHFNLHLSADENEISLLMQDDGKGFDIQTIKQKNGIGLRNIQLRTDYLKGKLEIDSSTNNGTTTIIEIPLH